MVKSVRSNNGLRFETIFIHDAAGIGGSSQSGSIDCIYHQSLRIERANAPLLGKIDCKECENKKLVEDMFFPAGRRHVEDELGVCLISREMDVAHSAAAITCDTRVQICGSFPLKGALVFPSVWDCYCYWG
ncbi:hypothetical protein QL285_026567 [Trifolium repens]|nr:hypothetical protein QL285_026567 [Trifolium repens]